MHLGTTCPEQFSGAVQGSGSFRRGNLKRKGHTDGNRNSGHSVGEERFGRGAPVCQRSPDFYVVSAVASRFSAAKVFFALIADESRDVPSDLALAGATKERKREQPGAA
jgi:hypothetical protein